MNEIHERGLFESSLMNAYEKALLELALEQSRSWIDFTDLDRLAVKQVHGGVFGPGHVSPYASLFLQRADGEELVVRGRRFEGAQLAGGRTRVSVEGIALGTLELSGDPLEFEERWALPEKVLARPFLTVRFESDDYVYTNVENGKCAAFLLERVSVE